jgi:hypothetical protein
MKKRYLKPSIVVVKVESRQMQTASVEVSEAPVDTSTPKPPGEALSRGSLGFSLWDEE